MRRDAKAIDTYIFDARLDVGDGGLFIGYHSWNDFHGDFMNTGQGAWFGRNRITIGHEDVGISVPSAWPKVDDWTWLIEIGLENQGDDHRPLDAQSAHIRLGYWRVHPAYSFNFIEGAWGEDFGSRFSHSFYLDGLLSIGSEEPFEPSPINISIEHFAIYDEGNLGSGGVKQTIFTFVCTSTVSIQAREGLRSDSRSPGLKSTTKRFSNLEITSSSHWEET